MPEQKQFIKRYQNFTGFTLKSSDLTFPEKYAQDINNFELNKVGSLAKRKGFAKYAANSGTLGLFKYVNKNDEIEAVTLKDFPKKFTLAKIDITYLGPALNYPKITIGYDIETSTYRCMIQENETVVFDQPLDSITVQTLANNINSLSNYNATLTGNALVNASYCKQVFCDSITLSSTYTIEAGYFQDIDKANISSSNYANFINSTSSIPASAVQINKSLYIADGINELLKYDGHKVYRAGLPTPSITGITPNYVSGPAILYGKYVAKIQYVYIDANGIRIEGNLSEDKSIQLYSHTVPTTQTSVINIYLGIHSFVIGDQIYFPGSGYRTVTGLTATAIAVNSTVSVTSGEIIYKYCLNLSVEIGNIQQSSGFNTACAIINGTQTNVTTFNVDNGSGGQHTFIVGDTAYFFDNNQSKYIERKITSITPTTITIEGSPVTVIDNFVVSANLRIAVYINNTTTTEPTLWYLTEEFPNNSFSATQSVNIGYEMNSLSIELIAPATDRSPPPKGIKYLTVFQNQIVAGNILDSDGNRLPNVIAWSDIESVEYFPTPDNQQEVLNQVGDSISALAVTNDILLVFKEKSIYYLSGDIEEGNYKVEQITADVGCIAHQSIQDIRGSIFFLSKNGPRLITGNTLPQAIGAFEGSQFVSRIDPLFDDTNWLLTRSWSLHDRKNQQYLLFIPKVTNVSGSYHVNSNSLFLVYDYARDSWLKWSGIDAYHGMIEYNDDIFFGSSLNQFPESPDLIRRQTTGSKLDYSDYTAAISTSFTSPWDYLGDGSVMKNYQGVRFYNTEDAKTKFTLTCRTQNDFISDVNLSSFSVTLGTQGYGYQSYGSEVYGGPDTTAKHKISNGRSKGLRLIFENTENQADTIVTGYEFEISTPYAPAMKE